MASDLSEYSQAFYAMLFPSLRRRLDSTFYIEC